MDKYYYLDLLLEHLTEEELLDDILARLGNTKTEQILRDIMAENGIDDEEEDDKDWDNNWEDWHSDNEI
jgi:hypothetical protein